MRIDEHEAGIGQDGQEEDLLDHHQDEEISQAVADISAQVELIDDPCDRQAGGSSNREREPVHNSSLARGLL